MSLLKDFSSDQSKEIARIVFNEHFKYDNKLNQELDQQRQIAMYQDILYNLSYLEIAIKFDDELIFEDYALWIYELLCNLMKDLSRTRIAQQMIDHYRILAEVIERFIDQKQATRMVDLLKLATQTTKNAIDTPQVTTVFAKGEYHDLQQQYLDRLLDNDTRGAIRVILDAVRSGMSIQDIYLHVLKEVMYQVGHLWHQNQITVD